MRRGRFAALTAGLASAGAALWWRQNPSPCPYGQRFWVQTAHPVITRARLKNVLRPQPGERILEIGPGTGYYTLDIAEWITGNGRLDIFDIQQEMLDHTIKRAMKSGRLNVVPTRGDARDLPFEDESFDAAILTTVLGEIPDRAAALREVARVLKPDGRLIVGELFGDPHWVRPTRLRAETEAAGLRFAWISGRSLGYFARFER